MTQFTQRDRELILKQGEDTLVTRNREMRFYDFLFLREGKNTDSLLALACNLPEWVKIANKSSSKAYLVTDQTSIELLKTKLFPEELGSDKKTYFDFLKEAGINFMTVDQLIKNLPYDNKAWKKLYDKINILVDDEILSPASIKDLGQVLVNAGFKGDHPQTVAVQKELDIIVDSKLARKFTKSNYILKEYEIQGLLNSVNVLTKDNVGRGILIQAPEAHGENLKEQRNRIAQKFSQYKTSASPEISAKRVRFIYTKKSLELATEIINKIFENRHKISSYPSDLLGNYKEKITREIAIALEKIAIINYGGKHFISNIDPKDLGVIGTVFLNSWTSMRGGRLHGQIVKPITEPSQIKSITDESQVVEKLTCSKILSLTNPELIKTQLSTYSKTKKLNDQDLTTLTSKESKKVASICLARPFGIDYLSYHPSDVTSIQSESSNASLSSVFTTATPTKIATLLLSVASNIIVNSSNSLQSISQINSMSNTQKPSLSVNLRKPTSAPALELPRDHSNLKRRQNQQ